MFAPSVGTMMDGAHAFATSGGTAWRRRQRRLRAFRRFVLWHSKMEVAAALHHTSGRRTATTPQFSSTAVEPIAPRVVVPLPPIEEFPGPVYNLLHQKQLAAGETPENLVEIPVVQEQVIVQTIPEVVDSLPPVQQFTGPGFFHVYHEHIAAVPAVTEFFPLSDDEGDAEKGSRPPCLGEPQGPQDRVQQRTVEQLAEVLPMVQILDIPEPQGVDQLVDVLRFVDALVPVAEQVIEVPKIILENIPPRRLVRDPQLAEQLVAVPTPFPAHVPVPRLEDQLVEVPQIVTHIVPRSFFVSTDGYIWCQLREPAGSTGGGAAPPTPSVHRQARTVYKYWPRVSGRPCDHAARVPAVPVVRSSTECWTFQLCHRREIPQCSS